MSKKIYISLGLIFILAISAFVIFKPKKQEIIKPPQKNIEVKIGYREHIAYAPLYVGIEEKFFEKEGLDIKPIKFESTNQLMEAMIAGKIDASLGGVNSYVLLTIEEKSANEYKILSLTSETSSTPFIYLLVRKDSDIVSIEQLKGKKIGMFPGSFAKVIYKKVMESYFDPSEAELIQMNANLTLQALEAKQVDAIIALEPLAAVGKNKGISKTLDDSLFDRYFFNNTPFSASAISNKWFIDNKEAADKLVSATEKAIDYINNNTTNTKNYITKYTPLEKNIIDQVILPVFEKIDSNNSQRLQKLADLLFNEKLLKKKIETDSLLLYD